MTDEAVIAILYLHVCATSFPARLLCSIERLVVVVCECLAAGSCRGDWNSRNTAIVARGACERNTPEYGIVCNLFYTLHDIHTYIHVHTRRMSSPVCPQGIVLATFTDPSAHVVLSLRNSACSVRRFPPATLCVERLSAGDRQA